LYYLFGEISLFYVLYDILEFDKKSMLFGEIYLGW